MWWIYEAKYRTVSREHFPQRVLRTGVCGGLGATLSSKTIDAHVFFFFLPHFRTFKITTLIYGLVVTGIYVVNQERSLFCAHYDNIDALPNR